MGPAVRIHIPDRHAPIGNSFGYSRWADALRHALDEIGAHCDDSGAADAIVHITPPHLFSPHAGSFNVLFTTFEAEILPDDYRPACHTADLVIVPSRHNLRVFNAAGVSAERCPLGIHSETFRFVERRPPSHGERFRYLWVGAPNPRKGWPILDRAWRLEFEGDSRVELYVKTTCANGSLQRSGNVIADGRCLTDQQLAELYASAHCFVFPSYGEGFGLTLAEAMATGLPAIFTSYGGVCDFASRDNGYPLKPRMIPVEYFGRNLMAAADPTALAEKMREVKRNYSRALARGRRAATELAHHLTWRYAARNLVAILSARVARASAA